MSKKNRTRLKKFSAFMLVFSILIGSLINVSPLYAEEGNFNNQYDQKEIFDVPTESVESKDATEESVVTEKTEEDLSEGDVTLDKGAGDIVDDQNEDSIPDIDNSNDENGIIEDEIIEDLPEEPVKEDLPEETDSVVNNFLANTDNPDHLAEPDESPFGGEIDYNIYPETPFGYELNLRNKLSNSVYRAARLNNPPKIGVDHPENPGDVMLFKEAKAINGMVNTWEVTLRIEGKDTRKTSDVVLVIDRSGSMRDYERMTAAKNAAKAFVSKLLPSDTTRIAVVSFASDVRPDQALTNNAESLNRAINGLIANGGTFTQGGIKQAEAILANSNADYKHIVLLSDGEPTYSYRIDNPDIYLQRYGNDWETTISVPSSAYVNDRVGAGNSLRSTYRTTGWPFSTEYYYYNHGNSAIAEAGFAGDAGYNVYTVGLQTNNVGSGVLRDMKQGSGSFTEVTDVNQLTPVFESIAGQINAAVKDAAVGDPMAPGFNIPAADVSKITTVPATSGVSYANGSITWNPGTLTTPISEGSDIKYAELKYTIELNDNILKETPDENGEYPTNGDAIVTYTDADGKEQTVAFPVPRVNPVLYKVVKELQDKDGNVITADRDFTVEVTGHGGNDGNETVSSFTLNTSTTSSTKLMTDLRYSSTYTFEETGDLKDYDVTYYVNGEEAKQFTIADDSSEDVTVKVVNKEKPGTLTITKVLDQNVVENNRGFFTKLFNLRAANPTSFTFTVTGPNEYKETFTLPDENGSWTKTLENLATGTYTVTEADAEGFTTTIQVDDGQVTEGTSTDVELAIGYLDRKVTITNKLKSSKEVEAKKIWVNGPEADHTAPTFELYADGEKVDSTPTVSPDSGTADEFTYKWTNLKTYNDDGTEIVYTVKEAGVSEENTITVNENTYEVSQDGNVITNTYTVPKDGEATATKKWVNGPAEHPTVWFKLFRQVGEGTAEAVPGADIKELKNGTTSVTWTDLEKTDAEGNAYTFTVKEVNAEGNDFTPENYTKAENGLTVTNTYVISTKGKATATKTWVNGPSEHPTVWFKLYRTVEGGKAQEVPGADVMKLENGTTTVTWTGLEETDAEGKAYTFTVKEVDEEGNDFVPAGYVKAEEGLTVTNTFTTEKVTIKKLVEGNMGDTSLNFGFSYKIDEETEVNFTLKHNEVKEVELPIGSTITVTETDSKGHTSSYDFNTATYSRESGLDHDTLIFTNTKNVEVPTGIFDNLTPMIIVLSAMIIGGASFIIYKKRQILED